MRRARRKPDQYPVPYWIPIVVIFFYGFLLRLMIVFTAVPYRCGSPADIWARYSWTPSLFTSISFVLLLLGYLCAAPFAYAYAVPETVRLETLVIYGAALATVVYLGLGMALLGDWVVEYHTLETGQFEWIRPPTEPYFKHACFDDT